MPSALRTAADSRPAASFSQHSTKAEDMAKETKASRKIQGQRIAPEKCTRKRQWLRFSCFQPFRVTSLRPAEGKRRPTSGWGQISLSLGTVTFRKRATSLPGTTTFESHHPHDHDSVMIMILRVLVRGPSPGPASRSRRHQQSPQCIFCNIYISHIHCIFKLCIFLHIFLHIFCIPIQFELRLQVQSAAMRLS